MRLICKSGVGIVVGVAVGAAVWSPSASAQAAARAQPESGPVGFERLTGPGLSIESHRLGAMHMLLRDAGAEGSPELADAASALRAIEEGAGSGRIWALLDPEIAAREEIVLPGWVESLPLARVVGEERVEETRGAIERYVRALTSASLGSRSWDESVLPELSKRGPVLRDELAGEDDLLGRTLAALGLERGEGVARIVLVPAAPAPGAMTYRTAGGPVSIVGEGGLDDDTLVEVTLHEAVHAFDALAAGERGDVLALVRKALIDAGLDERDPRFRGAWHALFFVHAAEMVRRDGRPEYVDYGERFGVYAKTGVVAGRMRGVWGRVLDGEVSVEEFVGAVVGAARGEGVDSPG